MNTCIIVGNGPTALSVPAVPGVPLFGMNYSPITPDYYVCIDTAVLKFHWQEIMPLAMGARTAYLSALHDGSSPLYDLGNVQLVSRDTRSFKAEFFLSGFTASYVALKMAYYLGFQEVHLYGVDHSPAWEHYRPDYPFAGWNNETARRRMVVMEDHYRLASEVYARAGRRIINHSRRSRLDTIFQRAEVRA